MQSTALTIQIAEDEFNAYARQAEDAPHKWGEDEEAHLARLADNLRRLYDENNVDEFDRVAL